MASSPPCSIAIQTCGPNGIAAFHWELEFPEVFFGEAGYRSDRGFDAIIGNPPYDVLSERETGHDLSQFKEFIDRTAAYAPSKVGKNNLYKLFICRAISLLAPSARLGFITPMAVLGDEATSKIRREIFRIGRFQIIEAFPQKDDPNRRVFRDAKLSTAVFVLQRVDDLDARNQPFQSRIHPADRIDGASSILTLTAEEIPSYDPENLTIVSTSDADWRLATRITRSGRLERLGHFAQCTQGEVNETVARSKGHLADTAADGELVVRGSNICLYVPRLASQGDDLFVSVERFLAGKGEETKAFDHRWARVGLQESSPQNNFRRIIASYVPAGKFCNHKVNYFSERKSSMPLEFILAMLNSKLADWYFRLGSTNAAVSHYQLHNLPCPAFVKQSTPADDRMLSVAIAAIRSAKLVDVPKILVPGLVTPPFSPAVRDTIIEAVKRIMAIESARGEIARTERSALDNKAQPYQDLIDQLFYRMAGLSDEEVAGLESRLARML